VDKEDVLMDNIITFSAKKRAGLLEAIRWMEDRIGTSLDLVDAGDPDAIATMERSMMKETLKARTKWAERE